MFYRMSHEEPECFQLIYNRFTFTNISASLTGRLFLLTPFFSEVISSRCSFSRYSTLCGPLLVFQHVLCLCCKNILISLEIGMHEDKKNVRCLKSSHLDNDILKY